jgi:hypothetical protein
MDRSWCGFDAGWIALGAEIASGGSREQSSESRSASVDLTVHFSAVEKYKLPRHRTMQGEPSAAIGGLGIVGAGWPSFSMQLIRAGARTTESAPSLKLPAPVLIHFRRSTIACGHCCYLFGVQLGFH